MSNENMVKWIRQGETSLMSELYVKNKRFIKSIVRHLKISPDNYEDAMQDAYFGLYTAVQGYDASKGFKFLTYAKDYIRRSIQRGQSYQMYAPEQVRQAANRLKRIRAELTQQLKRIPTTAELSKISGISAEKINYILNVTKAVKSIYEPLPNDDNMILGDTIPDKSIDIENDTANEAERQTIRAAVCCLCEQQKDVIECLYFKGLNVSQTSKNLGITEKETRSLKNKGLRALRKPNISKLLLSEYIDSNTSFYNYVGLEEFNNTWSSSTEKAVLHRERIERNNRARYIFVEKC